MGEKKTEQTINRYIKKYAVKHGITIEEAKEIETVKNVIEWYRMQEKGKI